MDFPLLDSSLIGFRAPGSDYNHIYCTARTISDVNQLTKLAALTNHIKITCLPNIWSPRYSVKHTNDNCAKIPPLPLPSLYSGLSNVSNSESSVDEADKISTFPYYMAHYLEVEPSSRFFVIKSFNELDIQTSKFHGIWTSTPLGNQQLHNAYCDTSDGSVFLFFLVNGSSQFCGVARMTSAIDFNKRSDIWMELSRWTGIFPLEWLFDKEIPNTVFHNLRVPTSDNQPMTNSRDTQEIPFDIGVAMLKIFISFRHLR